MQELLQDDKVQLNRILFYVIGKTKKKNGSLYTEQDKIEKTNECLSKGADVNAQDKNDHNNTILHIAVQKNIQS